MSRVSLARQQLSDAGQHATYYPAVPEGHRVENDGKVFLHVRYDRVEPDSPERSGGAMARILGGLGLGDGGEGRSEGEPVEQPEELHITIRTGYSRGGLKLADRTVTVTLGDGVFIGPFDPETYNQANSGTGQVYIDYSTTAGVSVAALRVP